MKTLGLIGGITPQSTVLYYQLLNQFASEKFGDKHSCKVVIHSVDFAEISELQSKGRWGLLGNLMANAGQSLEKAGADAILICANTMHLCIGALRNSVTIPVIHIAQVTAEAIQSKEISKVALLGTRYTMEKTFYTDILSENGIETIIPAVEDREIIHQVIYSELSKGELNPDSKAKYVEIIERLIQLGAEGIILGCTEIPLLIHQNDVSVPVFDTTSIHAKAGFEFITSSAQKM